MGRYNAFLREFPRETQLIPWTFSWDCAIPVGPQLKFHVYTVHLMGSPVTSPMGSQGNYNAHHGTCGPMGSTMHLMEIPPEAHCMTWKVIFKSRKSNGKHNAPHGGSHGIWSKQSHAPRAVVQTICTARNKSGEHNHKHISVAVWDSVGCVRGGTKLLQRSLG